MHGVHNPFIKQINPRRNLNERDIDATKSALDCTSIWVGRTIRLTG